VLVLAFLGIASALSVMPNAVERPMADLVSSQKADLPSHKLALAPPLKAAAYKVEQTPNGHITNSPENIRKKSMELLERSKIDSLLAGRQSLPEASIGGPAPFPVDFVITWFNSNDQGAIDAFWRRAQDVNKDELSADLSEKKRFTDAGELKYNLRGIDQYASFCRYIHLVVADHMALPDWLRTDHPKLRVVRHSQIFPRGSDLPTFNSHAIEANLHHIPGLAENFVYVNDDMFIHRTVSAWTFFAGNGRARIWTGGWKMDFKWLGAHERAVKNTLDLLGSANKRTKWSDRDNTLLHQVKPMTISMMRRAASLFPQRWHETQAHPFRHKQDLWPILMASVLCVEESQCRTDGQPANYFTNLGVDKSVQEAFSDIYRDHPTFICLNDSTSGTKGELTSNLSQLFPRPSRFEKV